MTHRAIDKNGQYSLNATGGHATDATMMPNVLLALRTSRGSVPTAPTFGRRMARAPSIIRRTTPLEIEADILEALAHLTEAGLIWDLTVSARLVSPTAVDTVVSFTDASGKQGPIGI